MRMVCSGAQFQVVETYARSELRMTRSSRNRCIQRICGYRCECSRAPQLRAPHEGVGAFRVAATEPDPRSRRGEVLA